MDYGRFIEINRLLIQEFIESNISEEYSFSKDIFPTDKKGVYFIFKGEDEDENPLYIGCTNRAFTYRLSQYLRPSDTGATFTHHYMQHELKNSRV